MVCLTFFRKLATVLAIAVVVAEPHKSAAFDIYWLPTGTGDWNGTNNWSYDPGGSPRFEGPPNALFEEVGVINNGGTATLAAPIAFITGGVELGQAAGDSGTLAVNSGGVFTSELSATTSGVVAVGIGGRGTLNVTGTGSLTAPGLTLGGDAASAINLSGNANVSINGGSTLNRNLRLTGPNVNFTSATGVTLQSANMLTAEITSASAHSAIKSPAAVALGGNLAVQFNGVTPAVNQSWNLVDANAIVGEFANAPVGGLLTNISGAPAQPLGRGFRLREAAGGTNGQLLQVALENMLVLRVNRDTGELSIRNPQGAAVTALDGYTITSPTTNSLLPAYKGISGAPAGNAGWEKAPMNSTSGLAEFKPTGSFNVSSSGTNVSLGAGFSKTAVASMGLGITGEDLAFNYHTTGGQVVAGQVEYVGTPFLNNISLIVDPTNGQATLKNDTLQSLAIDGYSIVSSTGSLSGAGWTSLAERPGSFPSWQESPASATALSETNPVSPLTLSAGQSITLGTIGNFSSTAAQEGLDLKFILDNEESFRFGAVSFSEGGGGLSGDYDSDSDIDGRDFLLWQRGQSPNPLSASDLNAWKTNFGMGAASGVVAAAVPEPSSLTVAALAIGLLGVRGRQHAHR